MSSQDSLNVLLSDSDDDGNNPIQRRAYTTRVAIVQPIRYSSPPLASQPRTLSSDGSSTYVLPRMSPELPDDSSAYSLESRRLGTYSVPSFSLGSSNLFGPDTPDSDDDSTQTASTVDFVQVLPPSRSKFLGVRPPPTQPTIDPDRGVIRSIQRNVIPHFAGSQRIAQGVPITPPIDPATGLPRRRYQNADSTNRPFHEGETNFVANSRVGVHYETRKVHHLPVLDAAMPLEAGRELVQADELANPKVPAFDHSIYKPGTLPRQETLQARLNPPRPFQDTWNSFYYHSFTWDPNNYIQADHDVMNNAPANEARVQQFPWCSLIRNNRVVPGYSTWYLLKLKMTADQSVGDYDGRQDLTYGAVFPGSRIPIPTPQHDVEWYRVVKMPDYLMYNNWEEASLFLVEALYRERYFLYENYANRYEETACNYHTAGTAPLFQIVEARPLYRGPARNPQYLVRSARYPVWCWRLRYGNQFLLRSELLDNLTHYSPTNTGTCVIDYICTSLQEKSPIVTRADIYKQFKDVCNYDPKEGVSFWDMCAWAKKYAPQVSLYAVHLATGRVMRHERTSDKQSRAMVFVIANFHCYPIHLPQFHRILQNKEKIHFTEFKWSVNTTSIGNAMDYTLAELVRGEVKEKLILFEQDLQYIALLVMAETMHYLDHMQWKVTLMQFKYPNKDLVYAVKGGHHDICVEACKILSKRYPNHFEFKNQNLVAIAFELFHIKFGEFPKSQHENIAMEKQQTLPLMGGLNPDLITHVTETLEKTIHRIDKSLAYGSTAMNMPDDAYYPCFGYLDEWNIFIGEFDPNVVAEYYLSEFQISFLPSYFSIKMGNSLELGHQIWNYKCVAELLSMNLIQLSHILYIRKASQKHSPKIFSNFARHIYEIFETPEEASQEAPQAPQASQAPQEDLEQAPPKAITGRKMAKLLLNMFIGMLNHNCSKSVYTSTVMNIHDVISFLEDFQNDPKENESVRVASFTIPKEIAKEEMAIYQLERIQKFDCPETHAPIWRQIIGMWNIQLLREALEIKRQGHLVLGFRTDCIYFIKSTGIYVQPFMLPEEWHFEEDLTDADAWKKIPRCLQKKYPSLRDEMEPLVGPVWNDITLEKIEACISRGVPLEEIGNLLVCGVGGSGKSHLLLKAVLSQLQQQDSKKESSRIYVLSPTHAALSRLREDSLLKDLTHEEKFSMFKTVASFFKSMKVDVEKGPPMKADILFIDEVSMLTKRDLYLILDWWKGSPASYIWFFGDFNQCYPVEGLSNYKLLYELNLFIKKIENRCILKYNPSYGRYDKETFNKLNDFLNKDFLHPLAMLKPPTQKLRTTNTNSFRLPRNMRYICYLNKTRHWVNGQFTTFKDVSRKKERVRIWDFVPGQEVIVVLPQSRVAAFAKENLINNAFYIVEKIQDELLYTKENPSVGVPVWYFEPTFAITVYKIQGRTLREDYCILDMSYFKRDMFYTALTRCVTWSQIHTLQKCNTYTAPHIWEFPTSTVSQTKLRQIEPIEWENSSGEMQIMYWYNWGRAAKYIAAHSFPKGVLSVCSQPKKQIEHRVSLIDDKGTYFSFHYRGIRNDKAQPIRVRMKYSKHSKEKKLKEIQQKRRDIICCLQSSLFDYDEIVKSLKEKYALKSVFVDVV